MIQTILMVIEGIARLTVNPALGGGGIGAVRNAQLLGMLATLIRGGSETKKELDVFAKEIQALVDANGNPSRGQWEAMLARDAAARAALEANAEALGLPAVPVTPPPAVDPLASVSGTADPQNPSDGTGSVPPVTGSTDDAPPKAKSKSKSSK